MCEADQCVQSKMAKVRMGPGPGEIKVEYGKLEAESELIRLIFLSSYFGYYLENNEAGCPVRMTTTQNVFPDSILSEGLIDILAMGTRKQVVKDAAGLIWETM